MALSGRHGTLKIMESPYSIEVLFDYSTLIPLPPTAPLEETEPAVMQITGLAPEGILYS